MGTFCLSVYNGTHKSLVHSLPPRFWAVGLLLLAGCTVSDFLVRNEELPKQPTFWERFDHCAMAEKYTQVLQRLCTSGSREGCGSGTQQSGYDEQKFFG